MSHQALASSFSHATPVLEKTHTIKYHQHEARSPKRKTPAMYVPKEDVTNAYMPCRTSSPTSQVQLEITRTK
jgi:hypothetical protein